MCTLTTALWEQCTVSTLLLEVVQYVASAIATWTNCICRIRTMSIISKCPLELLKSTKVPQPITKRPTTTSGSCLYTALVHTRLLRIDSPISCYTVSTHFALFRLFNTSMYETTPTLCPLLMRWWNLLTTVAWWLTALINLRNSTYQTKQLQAYADTVTHTHTDLHLSIVLCLLILYILLPQSIVCTVREVLHLKTAMSLAVLWNGKSPVPSTNTSLAYLHKGFLSLSCYTNYSTVITEVHS